MTRSKTTNNGNRVLRQSFRRGHRWLGVSVVVFVLFLAISGMTLNHASDMGLDRRYVSWSWLLDAYGIQAPQPSASYAAAGHRSTLLGERLFLDGHDTGQRVSTLTGFVVVDPLVVATAEQAAHIFMTGGELVEMIDLQSSLPGPVEQLGRLGDRAVIRSNGQLFRSDADIAGFELWDAGDPGDIEWSVATPPDAAELAKLDAAWRGRGLPVERVLLDLHSGRVFGMPGVLLMDFFALCMIVLGVSGLMLSNSRYRRQNGAKDRNSQ
jgi:hypothetical protein